MISHEGSHPEIVKSSESIEITPKTLLDDNHDKEADVLRKERNDNKTAHKLYSLDACGDSRGLYPLPAKVSSIRSIASGGSKESRIITNPAVEYAVVSSHFDGEIFEPGKMPTGCGGLGAKNISLKEKKATPIKGIYYYIEKNVRHPDPLIQAILTANKTTKETGKPSLAVAQNHRVGKIYPFGVFLPGEAPMCAVNLIDLLSEYNPEEIYAKGIPELERKIIPNIFNEFLEASEIQVKDLLLNYPNLKEMLKVQNPRMIVLSTEIISAKIRYPRIANFPGILFKLHLPRVKDGNGTPSVKPELLKEILNQVDYPFQLAVANCNKANEPFSKTDKVLIETEDIALSRMVASKLTEEESVKEWIALKDHQILVAQTQDGLSQIIEEFK